MPSTQEKIDFLSSQIHQKQQWLHDHGSSSKHPRPQFEIEKKQDDLLKLEAIRSDYEQSQKRRAG